MPGRYSFDVIVGGFALTLMSERDSRRRDSLHTG
jgi:hypothetical protein